MNGAALGWWRDAIELTAQLALPFVAIALVVGVLVSIVQAATQLQESLLSFAPKLAAVLVLLALAGGWMLERLELHAATALGRAARPEVTWSR